MNDSVTVRMFDVVIAFFGLAVLFPVLAIIGIIGFFDTGSPLLMQKRVGKDERLFTLVKFRTMRVGTPHVATHLATSSSVTPVGAILRRLKLDELPQLWNVLWGDMSLVGPRPCLPNQVELIAERRKYQLYSVRPGVTGLAQINGVDMSDPVRLAEVDREMYNGFGLTQYFGYLVSTALGKGAGDRVRKE